MVTTTGTTTALLACATCIGDPNASSTLAANGAIVFMLCLLAVVLGALIKFITYLNRRSANADS